MVLWGKLIVANTCIRKEEVAQINHLNFHLKNLEKKEQAKPNESWKKDIIEIRAEINKMETRKSIEKIDVGSWKDQLYWQTFS